MSITKPLTQEGDFIVFLEHDRPDKVYVVEKTEDLIYDYAFGASGAVATGVIGPSTQIPNIQPKMVTTTQSEIQCYQVRVGVDVGMVYTEMFAGTIRRTPYMQRKPTTALPYVGYFNQFTSPFGNPRVEYFFRANEIPAFFIYNNLGQTITPNLSFRGKKLRLFDLDVVKDTANATQMFGDYSKDPQGVTNYMAQVKDQCLKGIKQCRRVTIMGMED